MYFSQIDREGRGPRLFAEGDGPFDFTAYPSYNEILKHIDYYVRDSKSLGHVSELVIGKSYLGKPIVGVKVGTSG